MNNPLHIVKAVSFSILALTLSLPIIADDSKARKIMEKVDARDDGDRRVSEMEMILIDKRGSERIRKIYSFTRDQGEDTQ